MSKKVLILAASPRKGGNSDLLCESFEGGAGQAGHMTETIYLRDCEIGFCRGCDACADAGKCIQQDDMSGIIEKMLAADVIVLATPVYFYSMNAQMKALMDRCVSRYMDIKDKEFYFIATAAESRELMERTIDGMRGFTDCLPRSTVKGVIYGAGAWKKGDVRSSSAMNEAYEAGLNI